jgi:hypothetical protein
MKGSVTPRRNVSIPVPVYDKLRRIAFKRNKKISHLIVEFAATL